MSSVPFICINRCPSTGDMLKPVMWVSSQALAFLSYVYIGLLYVVLEACAGCHLQGSWTCTCFCKSYRCRGQQCSNVKVQANTKLLSTGLFHQPTWEKQRGRHRKERLRTRTRRMAIERKRNVNMKWTWTYSSFTCLHAFKIFQAFGVWVSCDAKYVSNNVKQTNMRGRNSKPTFTETKHVSNGASM